MKRFQSILCASLLTAAMTSTAFGGNITTAPGNITTRSGNITTAPGNITTAPGNITTRSGNITTDSLTDICVMLLTAIIG